MPKAGFINPHPVSRIQYPASLTTCRTPCAECRRPAFSIPNLQSAFRNQITRIPISEDRYSGLNALCPLPPAPCPMRSALCPYPVTQDQKTRRQIFRFQRTMPYALCPMLIPRNPISEDRYSGFNTPCPMRSALCPYPATRTPDPATRYQKSEDRYFGFNAPGPMRFALSPFPHPATRTQ